MTAKRNDYTDMRNLDVDPDKAERLYGAQTECALVWTNREGWPVGVLHRYVRHDERFWVSCTAERTRVAALRARPQSCVIISSEGTYLGGDVTITAKTLAKVHTDQDTKDWFYPLLAGRLRRGLPDGERIEFVRRLDTPSRVVIELEPVQYITYDGNRLEASLRGVPYEAAYAKATRNLLEPPDDFVSNSWEVFR